MNSLTRRSASPPAATTPWQIPERLERILVFTMVALFVVFAVGYSSAPIFEGIDEIEHYDFIRVVAETGRLPGRFALMSEYHQPPLYYVLAALVKLPIDDSDFTAIAARADPSGIRYDSYFEPFWALRPNRDHKAWFIHGAAEAFPYTASGTALAVHLIRLITVAFGAGTVVASYAIFRMVWPDRPHLRVLALGIVAFWPFFGFMSGHITNDVPLIFFSTLAVYLAMRALAYGMTWRRATLSGLILGAAWLTKVNAFALVAPVGLAIALDWRKAWRGGLLVLGIALAVAGWWYVEGAIVYGDPTGIGALSTVVPGSFIPLSRFDLAQMTERLTFTLALMWARFGRLQNIYVSPVMNGLYYLISLAGLAGAGGWFLKARPISSAPLLLRRSGPLAALGLGTLAAFMTLLIINRVGATPRFLLPAISTWAAVLAVGLDFWVKRQVKTAAALLITVLMAVLDAVCLFAIFLPSYRPLPLPAQIEYPLAIQFEDRARLIGVSATTFDARPGEAISLRLYWQALNPSDVDLFESIWTAGSRAILEYRTPGGANLPATDWHPGQTWAEEWVMTVSEDARPQRAYPLIVGVMETGRWLESTDDNGNPATARIGTLTVHGETPPVQIQYRFRESNAEPAMGLAQPHVTVIDTLVDVCLTWVAVSSPPTDYEMSVQLFAGPNTLIAANDYQPLGGSFPTSLWLAGESVRECTTFSPQPDIASALSGESWRVVIALLDAASQVRLRVIDDMGRNLGDHIEAPVAP